jgi:hypothetical protein
MKKILLLLIPVTLFLVSCSKQEIVRPPLDESYWLRKERGIVISSDFSCDYYVVETARGYSVLRSWGGSAPFPGDVLYGNLSNYGVTTFYNRSSGYLMDADVNDFWMSYFAAMDQVQWYCGDIFMRKADSTTISRDSAIIKNK